MSRGTLGLIAVTLGAAIFTTALSALGQQVGLSPLEIGRKIYMEGRLPSGEPVRGTVQGDVAFTGEQASCTSCHRPSGFGASEGGLLAPPVVGSLLYRPRTLGAPETGRVRTEGPGTRPAYDRASLARAIRDGVDPAGRAFDPLMPRFQLSDADAAALVTYLESLDAGPSPGISESVLHLATVVSADIDPARRNAILGTLRAFEIDRNADSRLEEERRKRGSWEMRNKHSSYRKWTIHVWELSGEPASWPAQLEEYYRKQPVFALLSGAVAGPWRPIHEFCEARRVPCFFPVTDRPVTEFEGLYSIYFSRGISLQAEALASHLRAQEPAPATVAQVFRGGTDAEVAAGALRRSLAAAGGTAVKDLTIGPRETLDAEAIAASIETIRPAALALWLGPSDLAALAGHLNLGATPIYLSATLLSGGTGDIPVRWRRQAQVVYPFGMPEEMAPRLVRPETWLDARKVPGERRARLEAFFAAVLLSDALRETHGVLVREYIIERLEHMVDRAVISTPYPRVTLGPGERFASKGCYLVRVDENGSSLTRASEWIVP